MALTKEKLITHLQTHIGLDKQGSRQIVERLLEIMKGTLASGEKLLFSGFGKFSVRQKNARLSPGHGLGQVDDEIGIVVARVQTMSAEIDHLMAGGAELGHQLFLQT